MATTAGAPMEAPTDASMDVPLDASATPQEWWQHIQQARSRLAASQASLAPPPQALLSLHRKATRALPIETYRSDPRLLDIWLDYLFLQRATGCEPKAISDTFKLLKTARIGIAFARLHIAWAAFEASTGNIDRARHILNAALAAGALPVDDLRAALSKLARASASTSFEDKENCIPPRDTNNSNPNAAPPLSFSRSLATKLHTSSNLGGSDSRTLRESTARPDAAPATHYRHQQIMQTPTTSAFAHPLTETSRKMSFSEERVSNDTFSSHAAANCSNMSRTSVADASRRDEDDDSPVPPEPVLSFDIDAANVHMDGFGQNTAVAAVTSTYLFKDQPSVICASQSIPTAATETPHARSTSAPNVSLFSSTSTTVNTTAAIPSASLFKFSTPLESVMDQPTPSAKFQPTPGQVQRSGRMPQLEPSRNILDPVVRSTSADLSSREMVSPAPRAFDPIESLRRMHRPPSTPFNSMSNPSSIPQDATVTKSPPSTIRKPHAIDGGVDEAINDMGSNISNDADAMEMSTTVLPSAMAHALMSTQKPPLSVASNHHHGRAQTRSPVSVLRTSGSGAAASGAGEHSGMMASPDSIKDDKPVSTAGTGDRSLASPMPFHQSVARNRTRSMDIATCTPSPSDSASSRSSNMSRGTDASSSVSFMSLNAGVGLQGVPMSSSSSDLKRHSQSSRRDPSQTALSTKAVANIASTSGHTSQYKDYSMPIKPEGAIEAKPQFIVNGIPYRRIELVGRGASSKVFKILDENTGQLYALKKVRLRGQDPSVVDGYINEISLLKRLCHHSRIIHLIDAEINQRDGSMHMVLEYGEIDLAQLLKRNEGTPLSINFIRNYWEQMLQAVQAIHSENIIHSDLKPANFLLVEGCLKLIDFGIAKTIPNDTTNIRRDHQTGTANYMAPEAILFVENNNGTRENYVKISRASDVWSLGCILYQFVYGQPPFGNMSLVQKLHAIVDPNHTIPYPPVDHLDLPRIIRGCLQHSPKARLTIQALLDDEFLHPKTATSGSNGSGSSSTSSSIVLTRDLLQRILTRAASLGLHYSNVDFICDMIWKEDAVAGSDHVKAT